MMDAAWVLACQRPSITIAGMQQDGFNGWRDRLVGAVSAGPHLSSRPPITKGVLRTMYE